MSTSFSIIIATKRGPKTLESLFINTHEESELIIIDSNHNEKTKQWLSEQDGYKQIVYAPCKPTSQHWMRNFSQSLNTAISYAENDWIVRADDYIEFKPDFFEVAENDINNFDGKFLIVGQKAQEYSGEEKFIDYMTQRGIGGTYRYINIEDPKFTFSFGLCPLVLYLNVNGYSEMYDSGWGVEDKDFLHRSLVKGYTSILDKQLMGYGHTHKPEWPTSSYPQVIYEVTRPEIECGKTWAFNSFNLKELREQQLKEKHKWIIR